LNMEEKRKLEKLLLEDVESAITKYAARRSEERGEMEKAALKNPPTELKRLMAIYQRARKEMEEAEAKMKPHGYRMDDVYRDGNYVYELRLDRTIEPKALRDYDEKTNMAKGALTNLKRTYTLKLFAGGEEAKELFSALARELASIVK